MNLRERRRFQKFIDLFYKSVKKEQEGEKPMMPFIMVPSNMGGGSNMDPLAFYKFMSEELEKQKKEMKEGAEKAKEKKQWYKSQVSFFQAALLCLTVGLIGGIIQLQLLFAFKAMLLRVIQ